MLPLVAKYLILKQSMDAKFSKTVVKQINKQKAGEMPSAGKNAQDAREHFSSVPSTYLRQLTLPITLAPGHLQPSSGSHGYINTCAHTGT